MIITFDNKKDIYPFKLYYRSRNFQGIKIVEIPQKCDAFDVQFNNKDDYEAFKAQALQYFDINELVVDETGGGKNNRFVKLTAKDFMGISTGATFSDDSNGNIISSVKFNNWNGSSCPTQLQNAVVIKDGISTYQGFLCKVVDGYFMAVGIEGGGKVWLYGVAQMNPARASCDKNAKTFGLSANPTSPYNINPTDILFVRYSNTFGGYLQVDILRNNQSWKTYQFDAPQGYTCYLGVSQGWMGGGKNIVATQCAGVLSGDKLCKKPLSNDEAKTICDEYNKLWS